MKKKSETPTSRFEQLDQLLDQALQLDAEEQVMFLDGVEESLRAPLQELLGHADTVRFDAFVGDTLRGAASQLADDIGDDPQQIGNWQLKESLGSGGMAQVFRAERDEQGYCQQAAIKVLWPHRVDGDFINRFFRERRILAAMDHPGVARFLDGGMLLDGRPWFAMEYVEGVSIVEHCQDQQLDLRQRLGLFLQVCDAVEFAHRRLIIHRDIKPENILVDTLGRVRLLDFGIAKVLDDLGDDQTRTEGNLLTLRYASPEQIRGEYVTVASDVYQLGLLLHQMMLGHLPYDVSSMSLDEAVRVICDNEVVSLRSQDRMITRDLDAIVRLALRKSALHRYDTVGRLSADIRAWMKGQVVSARPYSRGYVMRRFVQRHAMLVSVVIVAAFGLCAAVLVSVNLAQQARSEADRSMAVQNALTGFLDQADPFGDAGGQLDLIGAMEQGLPWIEQQLKDEPRTRFEVYLKLASIQTSVGSVAESLDLYRRAHELLSQFDAGPAQRLLAVSGVGEGLLSTGQLEESVRWLDAHLPQQLPADDLAAPWLSAWLVKARAYQLLGEVASLQATLEFTVPLIEQHGVQQPHVLMAMHNRQAYLARRTGDILQSEVHLRQALSLARELKQADFLASQLQNLAIHLARQARYDESEALFLESLAVISDIAPDHPRQGYHLNNYARVLYMTGRKAEAMETTRRAAEILNESTNLRWRYSSVRDLATYSFSVGDVATSLAANRQQRQLAAEVFGESSRELASARVLYSRMLQYAGNGSEAASILSEVSQRYPELAGIDLRLELTALYLDAGDVSLARQSLASSLGNPGQVKDEMALRLAWLSSDVEVMETTRDSLQSSTNPDSNVGRRQAVWLALVSIMLSGQSNSDELMTVYKRHQPVLTVLDDWRILIAMRQLAERAGVAVPEAVVNQLRGHDSKRQAALARLSEPEG